MPLSLTVAWESAVGMATGAGGSGVLAGDGESLSHESLEGGGGGVLCVRVIPQSGAESPPSLAEDPGEVEAVRVLLPGNLCQDHLVVIIAKRTTHFVVVHVQPLLSPTPLLSDFFRVDHSKLALLRLPSNTMGIGTVGEQLQEKLPQLDMS